MPQLWSSAMLLYKIDLFFVLLAINVLAFKCSDVVNLNASESADKLEAVESSGTVAAALEPGVDPVISLSPVSFFPDDLEISEYCNELLHMFGQRYVAYVNCLVPAARPVKVCQKCFSTYDSLSKIYKNISSDPTAPGNVSCRDSLLRSDRLMVVYQLYNSLHELWSDSACEKCVTEKLDSLTNGTLYFLTALNQTLTCFEKYQQGNHTELCKNCKTVYKGLNELYSRMEKNGLCIDIEDAMNITRRLWSKNFSCFLPRHETVPVIAVSSFMLFLPIIFYLSSFLHSEQKKRKLIHPRRAKSYTSLMNIQDKLN